MESIGRATEKKSENRSNTNWHKNLLRGTKEKIAIAITDYKELATCAAGCLLVGVGAALSRANETIPSSTPTKTLMAAGALIAGVALFIVGEVAILRRDPDAKD